MRIETEKIITNNGEPHTQTTYFCDNCGEQLLKTVSSIFVSCYITYYREKVCKCGKYKVFSWTKPLGFSYEKTDVVIAEGHQDIVISLNK